MRAFEAVVRLGSVNRAAEELGRTHGAVSKQLRILREEVGFALFEKVGTRLKANEAGEALAAAVAQAIDALAERYASIVREARSPVLTVACSATFAMGWLVPHLPRFSARHPDIRIRLSMTSAREMRDERDADLIILWDRSEYSRADNDRAIFLAESVFSPVAAPGYAVRKRGRELLAACRIVHDHTSRAWDRWSELTGERIVASSVLTFPHSHLCIGAARGGMGVAIAERRLVAGDLQSGALVRVGQPARFPDGLVAIPHRAKPLSDEARLMLAWLREELSGT